MHDNHFPTTTVLSCNGYDISDNHYKDRYYFKFKYKYKGT